MLGWWDCGLRDCGLRDCGLRVVLSSWTALDCNFELEMVIGGALCSVRGMKWGAKWEMTGEMTGGLTGRRARIWFTSFCWRKSREAKSDKMGA